MPQTNHPDYGLSESGAASEETRLLIGLLGQRIDAELEKPDSEIDAEQLMQDQMLLAELTETELPYTDEDLNRKLEAIKKQATGEAEKEEGLHRNPTSGRKRRRTFLRIAAVFAAVLTALFASLTVAAKMQGYGSAWDFITENIRKIRGLSPGESIDGDGIELVTPTRTASYHTMEELVEQEHLPVLYPTNLPDGVAIRKIRFRDEEPGIFTILISFSDADRIVYITDDVRRTEDIDGAECCTVNGVHFYITEKPESGVYQATGQYNGYSYSMTCKTYDDLLQMILNLKGFE